MHDCLLSTSSTPGTGTGTEGAPESRQAFYAAKNFSCRQAASKYQAPSVCGRQAGCFLRPLLRGARGAVGNSQLPEGHGGHVQGAVPAWREGRGPAVRASLGGDLEVQAVFQERKGQKVFQVVAKSVQKSGGGEWQER